MTWMREEKRVQLNRWWKVRVNMEEGFDGVHSFMLRRSLEYAPALIDGHVTGERPIT